MALERILVLEFLGVLSLELQHLFIEEHSVDVAHQEGLVELQLRAQIQAARHQLLGSCEDTFSLRVLVLNHCQVLGVAEVKAN